MAKLFGFGFLDPLVQRLLALEAQQGTPKVVGVFQRAAEQPAPPVGGGFRLGLGEELLEQLQRDGAEQFPLGLARGVRLLPFRLRVGAVAVVPIGSEGLGHCAPHLLRGFGGCTALDEEVDFALLVACLHEIVGQVVAEHILPSLLLFAGEEAADIHVFIGAQLAALENLSGLAVA